MVSLIFMVFVCFELASHVTSTSTVTTQDPKQKSDQSDQEVWTVYDHGNFGESELCRVLNCRKRDYCLVKGEDAICLQRKLLKDAPGHKVFFLKSDAQEVDAAHPVRQSVTKQRHRSHSILPPRHRPGMISETKKINDMNSAVEWDPERVRQKLAGYYRSLKTKERNRAALGRKNLYEMPNTFRENYDKVGQRSNGHGAKRRCTHSQLQDIGVRLLQWFSDMQNHHDSYPSSSLASVRQSTSCRREARWMFVQLDHDGNKHLDADELHALTYDQYEPCVKPFLDQCDRNGDARLSFVEWCRCFKRVR